MPVFLLSDDITFPSPVFSRPDGLLAVGGDLAVERLLVAYRLGIFPWFVEDEPILWWSPDPRLVLYPDEFRLSRSLKKIIRQNRFQVTFDAAFERVITACAQIRTKNREGTWIGPEMIRAYGRLHELGLAHSVEVWQGELLAGGLYGVALGKCFFGESMFTRVSNASKVGLAALVERLQKWSFHLIDCQVTTDHLLRCGAREIPRGTFLAQLEKALLADTREGKW